MILGEKKKHHKKVLPTQDFWIVVYMQSDMFGLTFDPN